MHLSKAQAWDYFILTARFLLGWTFLRYGYGKLTDNQFGLTEQEISTAIKDLSPFRISWYLFDMQPFKMFVGLSQIICGLLLIINRTAIIGAFLFLPIVSTILIIDLSYMPDDMARAFGWRLSAYILLDICILWHYKEKMLTIWNAIWNNVNTKFSYPIWMYLLLPALAIALEFVLCLPKVIFYLF